jgi:hypothetical protein
MPTSDPRAARDRAARPGTWDRHARHGPSARHTARIEVFDPSACGGETSTLADCDPSAERGHWVARRLLAAASGAGAFASAVAQRGRVGDQDVREGARDSGGLRSLSLIV